MNNKMEFFKKWKKVGECSICYTDIKEKDKKILRCSHILHQNCYEKLLKSDCTKCCPLCRVDFSQKSSHSVLNFVLNCGICGEDMDCNESECDIVKSVNCRCFYHLDCIMAKEGNFSCSCGMNVNRKETDLLSYLYFTTGYRKIVGEIGNCKNPGCNNRESPKRFGFCDICSRKSASNMSFAIALQILYRYVIGSENRIDIFRNILGRIDSRKVRVGMYDPETLRRELMIG